MENKKWYTYKHSIIMLSIIGILGILVVLSNIRIYTHTKEVASNIMGTIQVAQEENKETNEPKNNEVEITEKENKETIATTKENNATQNSEKSSEKQTSSTVKKENSASGIKTNTTVSTNTSSVTIGEKNALNSAKNYLNVMPFSKQGLIEQLEYEGYSKKEAKYGADNCGADWNEQASKMAKSYLDVMSFSRSGLIEQLKYEGFTISQAEYGVKAVGY